VVISIVDVSYDGKSDEDKVSIELEIIFVAVVSISGTNEELV